jgi:hypothetical protein
MNERILRKRGRFQIFRNNTHKSKFNALLNYEQIKFSERLLTIYSRIFGLLVYYIKAPKLKFALLQYFSLIFFMVVKLGLSR